MRSQLRKSDFLCLLQQVANVYERINNLLNDADYLAIRPYISLLGCHEIVRCTINSGISRGTFYRIMKRLTAESEAIRKELLLLCDLDIKE